MARIAKKKRREIPGRVLKVLHDPSILCAYADVLSVDDRIRLLLPLAGRIEGFCIYVEGIDGKEEEVKAQIILDSIGQTMAKDVLLKVGLNVLSEVGLTVDQHNRITIKVFTALKGVWVSMYMLTDEVVRDASR